MPPQQQRSEETRARLLDAAEACFARDGYDATGVAEICQAAGVSKGAFYHHFESKHSVFTALLDRWLAGIDEQLAVLDAQDGLVPQRLRGMAIVADQTLRHVDERWVLFLEFWSRAARDPETWRVTIQPLYRYRSRLVALVGQGIAEGSLAVVEPQAAANAIIALAIGQFVQAVLDPAGVDGEQAMLAGVEILLGGLERRQEP